MYEIPLTTMKKCFKDVYGDSIYSYQKRYRMNLAANMLLQDKEKEVQEIAASVGYENPGKIFICISKCDGAVSGRVPIQKETYDGK
ncbi:MAG: helix-turn-helix domain-containing protein [Blautia massiliensis (ex Durand et al. 2017)]